MIESGRVRAVGTYRIGCSAIQASGTLYQGRISPDLVVDSAPLSTPKSYFYNVGGRFRITGLGFLLHSPVSVDLAVFDAEGHEIATTRESPLYESLESGFRVPDVSLGGTAVGRIEVRVTPRAHADSPFPASIDTSDVPFFYLGLSTSPAPANPRCLPSAPFPAYQSPSGDPPRFASTRSARDGIGFCSKAQAGSRFGPRPADIAGWILPFLLIGAFQLNSILRRIRLKARWRNKD
jgi:hypothetical protein